MELPLRMCLLGTDCSAVTGWTTTGNGRDITCKAFASFMDIILFNNAHPLFTQAVSRDGSSSAVLVLCNAVNTVLYNFTRLT